MKHVGPHEFEDGEPFDVREIARVLLDASEWIEKHNVDPNQYRVFQRAREVASRVLAEKDPLKLILERTEIEKLSRQVLEILNEICGPNPDDGYTL